MSGLLRKRMRPQPTQTEFLVEPHKLYRAGPFQSSPLFRRKTQGRLQENRNIFAMNLKDSTDMKRTKFLRSYLTNFVRNDHIVLPEGRALNMRWVANELVTLAKKGDTASRQFVAYFLDDPLMVDKAFDEYPRRFRDYHGNYVLLTPLMAKKNKTTTPQTFLEFKNREMSDSHKGEDYTRGPERFFLPPNILETERGVQRPPHLQLTFDRWASKFKTPEFHEWWRMRHAMLRFWGMRQIQHPDELTPLWSDKEEEEWHNEMLANSDADIDLDEEVDGAPSGEGGS